MCDGFGDLTCRKTEKLDNQITLILPLKLNENGENMAQNKPVIEVVAYNPKWPQQFAQEAEKIQEALGTNCIGVHHVGSTSIPGIWAKPLLDIIPVVKDIMSVEPRVVNMEKLGYTYKGEHGIAFRRFFQKEDPTPTYNVHIYEENSPEIEHSFLFKEYLIEHPEEKRVYSDLKASLAKQHPDDITDYWLGKETFIRNILNKAGFKGYRMVQALTPREWELYHRVHRKVIFEPFGEIYDPDDANLSDKNYVQFVFIMGTDLIGCAQLQRVDEHNAILRSLAIDLLYQHQDHELVFLNWIEKWTKHQNCSMLYLYSSPQDLSFYQKAGYSAMQFNDRNRRNFLSWVSLGKKVN